MQMAQKSWKLQEIFPRFVNAQMAKGVSDKTVLTYNRHFHSLGYHLDMTMTFDELTSLFIPQITKTTADCEPAYQNPKRNRGTSWPAFRLFWSRIVELFGN